jgi:hypothetical protein
MTLSLVPAPVTPELFGRLAKTHSHFAPSKAHRWLVCPGSMRVMTDDPETEWAAEGTRKHAVLEYILSNKSPPLIAGDSILTEAGAYAVTVEVLEQCHEIKDFIEQFHKTHVDGWVVETETKVEIGSHLWPGMKPGDCDGTTDAAAYSYDELLVLDAKFGFVQVEARGNPQLQLYACGLLAEIPFPIKWVTLCIAQPGYDGLVVFREHRMTVEALQAWAFEQQHIVEEIQRGSRRLQADDHACRYCPARTDCPARLAALHDAADDEWLAARSIEELLPYVSRLKAICRDIEQRAMAELTQGKPVRGWKVVAAKSRRTWLDDGVADRILHEVAGTSAYREEMFDKKLKSPAQMEKLLYTSVFKKDKTKKEVTEVVNRYAFQPQGGPKLVPESDPRPALEAATWTLEDVLNASLEMTNGSED